MIKRSVLFLIPVLLMLFSLWYFIRVLSYEPSLYNKAEVKRSHEDKNVMAASAGKKAGYKGIVSGNIFHPDRTYAESSAEPRGHDENILQQQMPAFVLKGIIRKPDGEFIAYISQSGGRPRPLHVGDRFENMKVMDIDRMDVRINWNGTDVRLNLGKIKSEGVKR
ncbi:MAG TPA: hypothetical protein ENG86_04410 [Nitrospirae bacterium]|nr:hypothetical protein [Nitrospirota bacterium]